MPYVLVSRRESLLVLFSPRMVIMTGVVIPGW